MFLFVYIFVLLLDVLRWCGGISCADIGPLRISYNVFMRRLIVRFGSSVLANLSCVQAAFPHWTIQMLALEHSMHSARNVQLYCGSGLARYPYCQWCVFACVCECILWQSVFASGMPLHSDWMYVLAMIARLNIKWFWCAKQFTTVFNTIPVPLLSNFEIVLSLKKRIVCISHCAW